MFGFRRNKDHRAGSDRGDAFGSLDGSVTFHDEVEMLAVLMKVVGRRCAVFVAHDAGEHVVDLRELLIDEESAFAAGYGGDQPRECVFVEYVGHSVLYAVMLLWLHDDGTGLVCVETHRQKATG